MEPLPVELPSPPEPTSRRLVTRRRHAEQPSSPVAVEVPPETTAEETAEKVPVVETGAGDSPEPTADIAAPVGAVTEPVVETQATRLPVNDQQSVAAPSETPIETHGPTNIPAAEGVVGQINQSSEVAGTGGIAPESTIEAVGTKAIDPMIGEQFTFSVNLDNTSGTTLYGPYIDLYFESAGDDGDGDGIIFDNATYLGTNLTATTLNYTGVPLLHPYAVDSSGNALTISTRPDGTALRVNDTVVVLEMPFGSFTPAEPPANVVVTAHISSSSLVDAGGGNTHDYDVQVTNGFRYGNDALNNPATGSLHNFQDTRLCRA